MTPNFAFDRTAGSRALAAAGQRGRWTDCGRGPDEVWCNPAV